MKVTCQGCSGVFKVKNDVAPGKAFKFKCPKCGVLNRLVADENGVAKPVDAAVTKVPCAGCGTTVIAPPEGEPLCEQCRASRAVEEVRKKSQALMDDSDLEFPDEIFDGVTKENTPPPAAPTEKDEPDASDKLELAAPEDTAPKTTSKPKEELASKEDDGFTLDFPQEINENEEPLAGEKPSEPSSAAVVEEAKKEEPPVTETKEEKPAPAEPDAYYARSKDGLMIGPIKLETLRDLIVARKVHSDEECRKNDGDWMGMLEFPELFEIFESRKAQGDFTPSTQEDERAKLLESLKVKKQCEGCGAEIFLLEDMPHPLCDQCRIEALVAKKKQASVAGEPRYKIRNPDGLVLGPLRKSTVEDLIAAGNIHGREEVSIDGGDWKQISDVEDLAGLFKEEDIGVIDLTETIDG